MLLNFNCVPFADCVFYRTIPHFKFIIMARNMRALASPSLRDSSYFYRALTRKFQKVGINEQLLALPFPSLPTACCALL